VFAFLVAAGFAAPIVIGAEPETPIPPTAESSQKWKDWWAKNRGKAVFVIPPRASYDWH